MQIMHKLQNRKYPLLKQLIEETKEDDRIQIDVLVYLEARWISLITKFGTNQYIFDFPLKVQYRQLDE